MSPSIVSLCLCLTASVAMAQRTDSFFVGREPLPAFLFQEIQEQVSADQSRDQSRNEKKFIEASAYEIQELMRSGKVLFNSPWSNYLQRIMQRLLEKAPPPVPHIQAFVYQSTEVNAFATRQGYVLVSTALLAHVNSEADLAFILAHEYVHVKQEHALLAVRKEEHLKKLDYRSTSGKSQQFLKFNREQELEADNLGFELFMKSPWSALAPLSSMDVLINSAFPTHNHSHDLSDIACLHMPLPDWYSPSSLRQRDLVAIENEDDEQSTHYNVGNRRKNLSKSLIGKDLNAGSDYVLMDSVQFISYQNRAKLEYIRLLINQHNYLLAYDEALGLEKDGFDSEQLEWYKLRAIFALTTSLYKGYESEIKPGKLRLVESQEYLMHVLENMSKEELLFWAIKHHLQVKHVQALGPQIDQNLALLLTKCIDDRGLSWSDLKDEPYDFEAKATITDSLQALLDSDSIPDWKKKNIRKSNTNKEFMRYGWAQAKSQKRFKQLWDSLANTKAWRTRAPGEKARCSVGPSPGEPGYMTPFKRKSTRALPADYRLLALPTEYKSLNLFRENKNNYVRAEKQALRLMPTLQKAAKRAGLAIETLELNPLKLNPEALRDREVLEALFYSSLNDLHAPGAQADYLLHSSIQNRYNSRYLLFSGAMAVKHKPEGNLFNGFYAFFFPVFGVPTLIKSYTSATHTLALISLVDMQTGALWYQDGEYVKKRDRPDVLEPIMYDLIYQLKH